MTSRHMERKIKHRLAVAVDQVADGHRKRARNNYTKTSKAGDLELLHARSCRPTLRFQLQTVRDPVLCRCTICPCRSTASGI